MQGHFIPTNVKEIFVDNMNTQYYVNCKNRLKILKVMIDCIVAPLEL